MEKDASFSAVFSKLKKSDTYKTIQDVRTKIMASETKAGVRSSEGSISTGTGVNSETAKVQLVARSSSNAVLVSPKQRGNPLLKSICSVPWEYDETIMPDYVMGRTTCALFLSLRYHNLKPDYINERLRLLGKLYDLRVLLVQVDMKDPHHALKHLTRICLLAELTLMLAWSAEEAGKMIEMYKIFEHKPPDIIMERQESDPHQKLVSALTSIRSVNKTDATTLLTVFGSVAKLLKASPESLALVPGVGPQKASRIHRALHTPFLKADKRQKTGIAKYLDV